MPDPSQAPPPLSAPDERPPLTRRSRLKADRRQQLLDAAAKLVADRGFHGVRLEDLGAAVGISGPAVYRHFSNKEAVLVELLVGISEHLHTGGEEVLARSATATDAVRGLIDFHLDFALTWPALISVQGRDLANLPTEARNTVRRLQRRYVELWVGVLREIDPSRTEESARVEAHATFGLLNSTPYSTGRIAGTTIKNTLSRMTLSALGIDPAHKSKEFS